MWNFTTTNFVSSAADFAANPGNGTTTSKNTLWVHGPGMFKQDNIVAIYRNPFTFAVNGKLILDPQVIKDKVTTATDTTQFRLNFYVRRSGDVNSYYSNDFVFKGKDFHYEWTGLKTAAQLAKIIKKINKLYGDIYMKVSVAAEDDMTGTSTDKLVFENDNYGLFTDVTVEYWQSATSDCCSYQAGQWVAVDMINSESNVCQKDGEENCSKGESVCDKINVADSSESDLTAAGSLWVVKCVNGFGTYEQILHDLRLPTMENFRWTSPTALANEMPAPGMNYVQYTIHMVACRDILGGSAVGEVTHSKTTHVVFVPADCSCSTALDTAFQAAIKTAGMEKLLVDVSTSGDKEDPTKSPADVTKPVHEEKTDTRTDDTASAS